LTAALIKAGWHVDVLVRPSSISKLKTAGHDRVLTGELEGDISGLADCLTGCDVVFHAAAIRDRWGSSPEDYYRVNVQGTSKLLKASVGRVKRFVYVSSVGVHGYPGAPGIDESYPIAPGMKKKNYHGSKAVAESEVMAFASEMEVVSIRPTITYGPGDQDGMLTRLISLLVSGKFIRIGSGKNHLHLTYITDIIEGLFLAALHPAASGQAFIIAGPESISSGDLIRMIETCLGKNPGKLSIPEAVARSAGAVLESFFRTGAALSPALFRSPPIITPDRVDTLCAHRSYSFEKAQRLLGYEPRVSFSDGLEKTIHWMAGDGILTQ
jgi:dihydroflavonol-4-reductase